MTTPLFEAEALTVRARNPSSWHDILRDISFHIKPGDILGVVGESGSGKSTLGLACLDLLGSAFHISGTRRVKGHNIDTMAEKARTAIRGRTIGYVPQEPMTALNPGMTVTQHLAEGLRHSTALSRQAKAERIGELLQAVGLDSGPHLRQAYPHTLSGGQRQRILLAAALVGKPDLLIADEATTALDPASRDTVVALLKAQAAERGMATILISHDLELVARHTSSLLVLRGGSIVEQGQTAAVMAQPASVYLRSLLALSLRFTPRAPLSLFPEQAIQGAEV